MSLDLARFSILEIGVQVIDFDMKLAEHAGDLRQQTRHLGLSLGDRACLALAEREEAAALTADRKWTGLRSGIQVQLIR
jgi:PIN domain nuclease of toxin-antitoxin system